MKPYWLAFSVLAFGVQARLIAAQDPVIQVEFSDPNLSPPHWTLVLHPNGFGHFHSEMGAKPAAERKEIEVPEVDRDIQLSPAYAQHIFAVAQQHRWFNTACESHLKVAFTGWKTFTYTGPEGKGSCTYNYSKDKEIEALGESIVAVAETIEEGAKLETLLQHDRLGLDQEMEYLTSAAADGRVQQICAIRGILERLMQDDAVLERVKKRARELLSHGST